MTLLFARGGSDLREVHSRSHQGIHALRPVDPRPTVVQPLRGLVRALASRFAEARRARALRRELEALSDAVLEDFGMSRTDIPKYVSQMRRRRREPRIQMVHGLSQHLLNDLAVSVGCGDTKVYTSVPLGVVSVYGVSKAPANTHRYRKTG
jgi:uncharacterized protein YjiS (DUF1127 family)